MHIFLFISRMNTCMCTHNAHMESSSHIPDITAPMTGGVGGGQLQDGITNGEELGDPCCRWQAPAGDFQISRNLEYRRARWPQLCSRSAWASLGVKYATIGDSYKILCEALDDLPSFTSYGKAESGAPVESQMNLGSSLPAPLRNKNIHSFPKSCDEETVRPAILNVTSLLRGVRRRRVPAHLS